MKSRKSGSGAGFGHRRMLVEQLERRSMLAGNVTAFEAGGSLFVRGDNSDNLVLIQQTGDNEYTVTGLDFADANLSDPPFSAGPTSINGDENGTVVFTGITGDIIVDLKKGDDGLGIGNTVEELAILAEECGFGFGFGSGSGNGTASGSGSFPTQVEPEITSDRFLAPRNLIITTGDGNDGVAIVADVRRNAIINTGNGFDAVGIGATVTDHEEHSVIGDDLVIVTGKQDDFICIHGLFVEDQVVLDTGDGNDDIFADGWDARGVTIVTGNGNDLVELDSFDLDNQLVINTGNGNDGVFVDDFSTGQGNGPNGTRGAGYVTVVTGNGNDDVELTSFDANGVTINTGAGNDGTPNGESPITVADAEIYTDQNDDGNFDEGEPAGPLTIVTGAGNDLVDVVSLDAGNIVINLGPGANVLNVADVFVANNVSIVGGSGRDTVSIADSTVGGTTTIVLGAGNDTLNIFNSTSRRTRLFGGPGRDTLTTDSLLSNGSFDTDGDGTKDTEVREFEIFLTFG